jgi:hypothetical protein
LKHPVYADCNSKSKHQFITTTLKIKAPIHHNQTQHQTTNSSQPDSKIKAPIHHNQTQNSSNTILKKNNMAVTLGFEV